MGGIFSKTGRPKLPGAYFNFAGEGASPVPASPGAAVAIPFTHDWGPLDETVRVSSFGQFQAIYGTSDDTDGYRAVRQAFQGEGVDGRGGAGEVVCHRIGAAAAAKAVKTLNNTTPAAALTLTAVYEGTRGNDLKVTTQNYAADSAKNELIILDGTVVLERYRYTDTNITALAADINANSNWVTASGVTSGVALANVSGSSFASGNDGTTILIGDWTDAIAALELSPFAALCAYGLTDSATVTAVIAWAAEQNTLGKRFFTVLGGAADESVSTAVDRSVDCANENILNVGVGTLTDATLGTGGTSQTLGTAEFAARVAGALVARGELRSLTYARFAGVELTAGATLSELETCFDGGVIAFARDSHIDAPVHIKAGLTTWTQDNADGEPTKPYLIYRQPKYVRTMHGIETDLTEWAEDGVLGGSITESTKDAVVGAAKQNLAVRTAAGAIQEGWTVGIDQDPMPTSDDEFIALKINVSFARALEQIYFTVSVG